jgi:ribosome-associated protein
MPEDLFVTDDVVIPASDLRFEAVRASGPGGQNVNKVSTKVSLRFDLDACGTLSGPAKERLRRLARNRLDAGGRVVVVSQATRNQAQNLQDAREKLAALIREALSPPRPRRPTRPSTASKRRRLEEKRRQSEKKSRRARVDDTE